ncbi:WD40 repeat domain-containing protein [Shinella sp. S4-D37]|uniref:WD40 repeat domain-containing protein n=1 Tax=Shinella sp. S4-D37 TaxID=3161999 RepID=UPI0034676F08
MKRLAWKWLALVLLALAPIDAVAQRSETDLMLSEYWAGTARELTGKGLRIEAIAAALKGIPEGTSDEGMHQFQLAHDALYTAMRSNNFALPVGDTVIGAALSPDRKRTVIATLIDGTRERWELWDVEKRVPLATLRDGVKSYDFEMSLFSYDSRYFISKADDSNFQVHDVRDGKLIGVRPLSGRAPRSDTMNMLNAVLNPSGTRLATVTWAEGEIRVWSFPDLELLMSNTEFSANSISSRDFKSLFAHFVDDDRLCLAVRSARASVSDDLQAGFMDAISGSFSPFYASSETVRIDIGIPYKSIDCSPDGRWAVLRFGNDKLLPALEVVDTATGEIVLRKDNFEQSGIAFHPQRPLVAIAQMEGIAYLDLETKEISYEHPFATAHYKPYFPLLFDTETGEKLGWGDTLNYLAIGMKSVWDEVPIGRALMDEAFQMLPPEFQNSVNAERIP